MSQPTRKKILDAHKALSDITYLADTYLSSISGKLDETRKLRQTILAALPPKPQPTMAEVEWDSDKHYLAEAEHPEYGKVIMFGKNFFFGHIRIMRTKEKGAPRIFAEPESLTLTGKRYTLTEVQE